MQKKQKINSWIAVRATANLWPGDRRLPDLIGDVGRRLGIDDLECAREDVPNSDDQLDEILNAAISESAAEELRKMRADAAWGLRELEAGRFADCEQLYVAICDQKVLAFGDEPGELRKEWAPRLGVPPQRIVIEYVGRE